MKEDQELYEQIEAYLAGGLDKDSLQSFEERMNTDPELRAEVNWHQQLQQELEDRETLDFQRKLMKVKGELDDESDTSTVGLGPGKRMYWSMAAVIALLLVFSIFYFSRSSLEKRLYGEYYDVYLIENIKRTQGSGKAPPPPINAYIKEDYNAARVGLIEMIAQKKDDKLLLYLANCELQLDNPLGAIITLQNVESSSEYYDEALWYGALAHLKSENSSEAVILLEQLQSMTSIYTKPAKDLLKDLQKE
ncbi:MAG: hypothetical protein AAFX87_31045 [Bacteroidota bacterium]